MPTSLTNQKGLYATLLLAHSQKTFLKTNVPKSFNLQYLHNSMKLHHSWPNPHLKIKISPNQKISLIYLFLFSLIRHTILQKILSRLKWIWVQGLHLIAIKLYPECNEHLPKIIFNHSHNNILEKFFWNLGHRVNVESYER
jgi:hypothetical protein